MDEIKTLGAEAIACLAYDKNKKSCA